MTAYSIEITIKSPAESVTSVLSARPASWLRGFLGIAVRASGEFGDCSDGFDLTRFRLGRADATTDGSVVYPFSWRPNVREQSVFSSFTGALVVRPTTAEVATLELHGHAVAGHPDRCVLVLASLAELLGAAFAASAEPITGARR